MTHDEAVAIVVQAGPLGQQMLLKVLFEEMNSDALENILNDNGYVSEE